MTEIESRLYQLAVHGITTSICYGQCGDLGIVYSVNVLTNLGESFNKPFAAQSLLQAVEIAEKESRLRGWII